MKQRIGFTLIEMLVVVMIITMLAGLTLSAVGTARNAAAAARTRATIEKINRVVMKHYASYQYRKVDIGDTSGKKKDEVAKAKLNALRILIRHEMPDRASDLSAFNGEKLPSITKFYSSKVGKNPNKDFFAAELLYMQVMADPVGAGMFSEGEIGDFDQDGLPEFLDGWGRPIRYLLWPAGFFAEEAGYDQKKKCESDLQLNPKYGNEKFVHDPFDTANIEIDTPALYPLIYSAGPDGIYDINVGRSGEDGESTASYDKKEPKPMMVSRDLLVGEPANDINSDSAVLHHYDNITNHSMLTNSN